MKIKIEVSDDTTTSTITKDFTCWPDVFPDFLNALRGAGFSIDEKVAVYMPGELAEEFGSGDEHILYDSDLFQGNTQEDIAGAIFDFGGYLTTLDKPVTFGASKNASPMVEHIKTWAQKRGLELAEANVERWNNETGQDFVQSESLSDVVDSSENLDGIQKVMRWFGETVQDEITRLSKEVDMEKVKEECQKIEKQLSEPKRVDVIPLGDGKELRWVSGHPFLDKKWTLFQGEHQIRYLDQFETKFVEAALKAANA